ncbi:hypothetical protein EYF80_004932 [Liparis tanakae]|uniref:Uncharacterized protein n=1 Tax=Liparis tanakae TaxID=230148 RepID=A0A4Z2J4E2_9TELE|nr:hypothetical protein EYF80_004932 [Liparis tanakae]
MVPFHSVSSTCGCLLEANPRGYGSVTFSVVLSCSACLRQLGKQSPLDDLHIQWGSQATAEPVAVVSRVLQMNNTGYKKRGTLVLPLKPQLPPLTLSAPVLLRLYP